MQEPNVNDPMPAIITRAAKRRWLEEQENGKPKPSPHMALAKIVDDLHFKCMRAIHNFRNLPVSGPCEEVVARVLQPRQTMSDHDVLIAMSIVEYVKEEFGQAGHCESHSSDMSEHFLSLMEREIRGLREIFHAATQSFRFLP
eukprot:2250769-Pleurochrysis_carterae.AAC.1